MDNLVGGVQRAPEPQPGVEPQVAAQADPAVLFCGRLRDVLQNLASLGFWERGRMQPAAMTRLFSIIAAPSCRGLGGVKTVTSSSLVTLASRGVPVSM